VLRFSRHASLVMGWVELFAPVVFQAYRPRERPSSGSLCWTTCRSGCTTQIAPGPDRFPGVRRDGYDGGRPRLWRLEASTTKSQPNWDAFLGALGVAIRHGRLRQRLRAHERGPCLLTLSCTCASCAYAHALERLKDKIRVEGACRDAVDELLA